LELEGRSGQNNELGDSVTDLDDVVGNWIVIHQRDANFTAVARINETGGVSAGNTVLRGQTRAWEDEGPKTLGDGHGETGAY
jgi:hypothetical protein